MNAAETREGDALSTRWIQDYWDRFTGTGEAWNIYRSPLRYMPQDRWATRDDWINAAKLCLERQTKVLFGLEVLLAEGFAEYMGMAEEMVQEWIDKYNGHDPEYYYDILKHFPPDHPARCKYLSTKDLIEEQKVFGWYSPFHDDAFRALVSVEDKEACTYLAGKVTSAFSAFVPDEDEAESALTPMRVLGRRCEPYMAPSVMDAAKSFCLAFLEKDREVAPHYLELTSESRPDDRRVLWIRGDISYLSWRVGWYDVLAKLRNEPWYWKDMFGGYRYPHMENTELLIWSQYLDDDTLRRQALQLMRSRKRRDERLDAAIAWVRMSHAKWPPGQ